jgi:hypothetical protein
MLTEHIELPDCHPARLCVGQSILDLNGYSPVDPGWGIFDATGAKFTRIAMFASREIAEAALVELRNRVLVHLKLTEEPPDDCPF